MISLEVALDRLLHRASYRRALLEGRYESLDVAPGDLEALKAVDVEELARAAARVKRGLSRRTHRGCGGLAHAFAETFAPSQMDDFLESDAFDAYRETDGGSCLEEAFFRFCEDAGVGDAAVREDEFLTALMKALATSPAPRFRVPERVHACAAGWWAIGTRGPLPKLYAAVNGRVVIGAVTQLVADLVARVAGDDVLARRHGASMTALAGTIDALRALGLR